MSNWDTPLHGARPDALYQKFLFLLSLSEVVCFFWISDRAVGLSESWLGGDVRLEFYLNKWNGPGECFAVWFILRHWFSYSEWHVLHPLLFFNPGHLIYWMWSFIQNLVLDVTISGDFWNLEKTTRVKIGPSERWFFPESSWWRIID